MQNTTNFISTPSARWLGDLNLVHFLFFSYRKLYFPFFKDPPAMFRILNIMKTEHVPWTRLRTTHIKKFIAISQFLGKKTANTCELFSMQN